MRTVRVLMCALWVAAVLVRAGVAQEKAAPAPGKTTLEGVYTTEQADRGQKLYGMTCLGGCHNAASHKGGTFKGNWAGHQVDELFEVIKDTMPNDNPGNLSAKEAAEIVSYMLKVNGVPAGKEELSTDPAVLKKIRIEVPPAAGGGQPRQ